MAFKEFAAHLKKLDRVMAGAALSLSGFGLLSLYSSSLADGNFLNLKKQAFFLAAGFLLMLALSFFDWRVLRDGPYLILSLYFLCLAALAGLFFFAPEIREIRSWYKIGGFSVNPMEFTKLILIILLAKYFSDRHVEMYRARHIFLSGVYVFLPAALAFFQPDLGSALVLAALWAGILVVSGIKLKHFLGLAALAAAGFALSWAFLLHPYQKERIASFLSPQFEPLGANWSQNQSKIAIGSGGVFGQGIGRGSQTQYGFLPEPQTDFIFAAIAEEFGLAGVAALFALFSVLFWRIMRAAVVSKTNFPRLFASGLGILIAVQFSVNIGMNLGVFPVVGIPLPLVSYGGSSLIAIFAALGILQNIKINR